MKIKTLFNYKILFFMLMIFLIICIKPSSSFAKSISSAKITLSYYNKTYTGSAIKPSVTVKNGTKTLKNGQDYTVSYSNNINAGTAKVTIKGKGTWTSSKTISFSITKSTIVSTRTAIKYNKTYTYTGSAIKPSVTVENGTKTLKNGRDYTVSYSNNINAGTARIIITGKGNYTGIIRKDFKINKPNISNKNFNILLRDSTGGVPYSFSYTGHAIKPSVSVTYYRKTLKNGRDYTVSYSNNKNIGTAKVIITGKGNYTGTKTVNFKIVKKK